jgi:Tol biopolymer transport system component
MSLWKNRAKHYPISQGLVILACAAVLMSLFGGALRNHYTLAASSNSLNTYKSQNQVATQEPVSAFASYLIVFDSERTLTSGDKTHQIYALNADFSNVIRLTRTQANDTNPRISPDGQHIAFVSDRANKHAEIFVMDADGSNQTQLTTTTEGGESTAPAWSPDGKQIAFETTRSGNSQLYVMNADGTNTTALTTGTANNLQPAWSPDGQTLLFQSDRDGAFQIYSMNVDGTKLHAFHTSSFEDTMPAWSPDGQQVAYCSKRNGDTTIYTIAKDGSGDTVLVPPTANAACKPMWSPDGKFIVFDSTAADGSKQLYITSSDGSGTLAVASSAANADNPAWNPVATVALTIPTVTQIAVLPTTAAATTEAPTDTPTVIPTTAVPTNTPTTVVPTTLVPTTVVPTTIVPTTIVPTTVVPTTLVPTTVVPTNTPTTVPTNTPTSTATLTPTATATPVTTYLDVLFSQNFDSGAPSNVQAVSGKWQMTPQDTGNAYCINTLGASNVYGILQFGPASLKDYSLEFSLKIIDDGGDNNSTVAGLLRVVQDTLYGNYFNLHGATIGLINKQYTTLKQFSTESKANTWYTIRAEITGNHLREFINGQLRNDATDPQNTILAGDTRIQTSPNMNVCVDNIVIRSLDKSNVALKAPKTGKITTSGQVFATPVQQGAALTTANGNETVYILDTDSTSTWTLIRIERSNSVFQGWIQSTHISAS